MSEGTAAASRAFEPGALVRARGREWVVVAREEDGAVLRLQPLDGTEAEGCGVLTTLEEVRPARFPPPPRGRIGDVYGLRLLFDAARLLLRSGAAPIRCLGRISVVPRPYQFVPLLMALRLDPVRLLIADDVGTGKTVEAALIARELLNRGVVRRIGVLAPAHLCDQWQRELEEKFALRAELVLPSTLGALERRLPRPDQGVWQSLDAFVASVDFVKSGRHREHFLRHPPDLLIVDEAHLCARPRGTERERPQQQRYELLRDLVDRHPDLHLLLVTATPHSGIAESFRSLLGLLDRCFENDPDRRRLRRHIVQRRRREVEAWLGTGRPFPRRETAEARYRLSSAYRELFEDVLAFCREQVAGGELREVQRRVKYWGAVAILRCVLSSPEAARTVLEHKAERLEQNVPGDDDPEAVDARQRPYVTDVLDEAGGSDVAPAAAVAEARPLLTDHARRRLRDFARRAAGLAGPKADAKLAVLEEEVRGLLDEGYAPIVFCRYIPTAEYVGRHLREAFPDVDVEVVTGALPDERRRKIVEELGRHGRRILVATDCLSEGINLQEHFDAVVHYDLPWNPNRLEQREGRVDRFGQRREVVKAITLYGEDNEVDLAVLEVLIRKARRIREDLGVGVPVPVGAEEVLEAVIRDVLLARRQLELPLVEEDRRVRGLLESWDRAVAEERESRSYYAQEGISPDEVQRELQATDAVLGDAQAVRRFLQEFAAREQGELRELRPGVFAFHPGSAAKELAPLVGTEPPWEVVFDRLADPDALYLGRTHPLMEAAARRVVGRALGPEPPDFLARLGCMRTDAVERVTALLLLRLRYRFAEPARELFAEEVLPVAVLREQGRPVVPDDALERGRHLATAAEPCRPDPGEEERRWAVGKMLDLLGVDDLQRQAWWRPVVARRCRELREAHGRIRGITGEGALDIRPHTPPDLLALVVLLPGGVRP